YRSKALSVFHCPANDITNTPYANSASANAGRMISYNMSTQFTSTTRDFEENFYSQDRTGYRPTLALIGSGYMKVAVFEGHRYASENATNGGPDFDFNIDAGYGGAFGGVGPWYYKSNELNRALAPGEPLRQVALQRPGL